MSNKMWGGRFAREPRRRSWRRSTPRSTSTGICTGRTSPPARPTPRCSPSKASSRRDDARKIAHGLDTILSEIEAGKFKFKRALEDIHMNVESRLAELIGPAAGRLHTARSRNDQVATDFRLWVRDAHRRHRRARSPDYQRALAEKALDARRDRDAGLHPSADRAAGDLRPSPARLCGDGGARSRPLRRRAQARLNESPLGAAALAGTVVSDRPRHDREGARLRPADGEFARCGLRPRLRAGDARRPPRSRRCICRALPKRS